MRDAQEPTGKLLSREYVTPQSIYYFAFQRCFVCILPTVNNV